MGGVKGGAAPLVWVTWAVEIEGTRFSPLVLGEAIDEILLGVRDRSGGSRVKSTEEFRVGLRRPVGRAGEAGVAPSPDEGEGTADVDIARGFLAAGWGIDGVLLANVGGGPIRVGTDGV